MPLTPAELIAANNSPTEVAISMRGDAENNFALLAMNRGRAVAASCDLVSIPLATDAELAYHPPMKPPPGFSAPGLAAHGLLD
jgi:hypothetical protein